MKEYREGPFELPPKKESWLGRHKWAIIYFVIAILFLILFFATPVDVISKMLR